MSDESNGEERSAEIRRIVECRRIEDLIHFTHASNLPSIVEHGVVSVSSAIAAGLEPRRNDQHRLDGRPDGTSLSISFPNVGMLNKYRHQAPYDDFVVLVLDVSILWRKACAFYPLNAAHHLVRDGDMEFLRSPRALEDMFAGVVGNSSRHLGPMLDCDPTDEQAEVLVFDRIDPELVRGVFFDCERARAMYAPILGDRPVVVHEGRRGIFGQRFFFRHRM